MNIDGHEVERRVGRMYVDGQMSGYGGTSGPDWYEAEARRKLVQSQKLLTEAKHLDLIEEFVRREAAEKAAADAARELDRRAKVVWKGWTGLGWEYASESSRNNCRNVVRALDADAAEQAT